MRKKPDRRKKSTVAAEVEEAKGSQAPLTPADNDRQVRIVEQRDQRLLEAAPDAMVVADVNGTIAVVNAERLFGYTRAELLGQSIETLVPESAAAEHIIQIVWRKF